MSLSNYKTIRALESDLELDHRGGCVSKRLEDMLQVLFGGDDNIVHEIRGVIPAASGK